MVETSRRRFIVVNSFTLLLFVGLITATWLFVESQKAIKIATALETQGNNLSRQVSERLHTSAETLRAVASLLTTVNNVDYQQFSNFAGRYLEDSGGLLFLEWQPQVSEQDREAFVQQARQQGVPNFHLWEPDADGQPIPARNRPLHVPVYFMLAKHGDADTTGLDLAWSDERMLSKWEARRTGQPQSSGFFRVVTGEDSDYSPPGLAITLPIYDWGIVPDNEYERHGRLKGYLAGVYDLEALVGPLVADYEALGINIAISDGTDSGVGLFADADIPTKHQFTLTDQIFNNTWRIQLTANETFTKRLFEPVWLLLPGLAVLLGLVVLAFMRLLQQKTLALEVAHNDLGTALEKVKESESFLRELSRHDPLTGLFNRRAFLEQLVLEIGRCERQGFESSLLMLDLDHFKRVNDTHGHPVGDEVIKVFASLCHEKLRTADMVARLGGEEFGMLLPHADAEEARLIAERLRADFEKKNIALDGGHETLSVTVSIGIATTTHGITSEELVSRSDKALYLAKQSGRNCVRVFE